MTYRPVQKIEVIRTELSRRGSGKDISDPMRILVQYWTLDGELLAEVDAYKDQNETK